MPVCMKCENEFPNCVVIDGRKRNLNKRKYCLDCSPFGEKNRKQLHKPFEPIRASRKNILVAMMGGRCDICKYDACLNAMCFHHVIPKHKKFCLSGPRLSSVAWKDIVRESLKTVCLCCRCHLEFHAGFHQEKDQLWKDEVNQRDFTVYWDQVKSLTEQEYNALICEHCGKEFEPQRKNERYKYCSRLCVYDAARKK